MKLTTVLCLATALMLPLALGACNEEGVGGLMTGGAKHLRPIPPEMLKLMDDKGMRPMDPILIRVFKEEATLEIWKRDKSGEYAPLKSYQMCAWGGTIGPKIREGDKQSPEGFYQVSPGRMNPNSQFFLSFDLGYPNAFDRAFNRTGSAVMVHGNCTASAGCFVVTDTQVQEIYAIAREALAGGQSSFQVQAYPFRMTAENMARHRRNPNMAFWRNIKEGNDVFEVTRQEPKVDVCDRRYVFEARPTSLESTAFNPLGACPAYKMPENIAVAVSAKSMADETAYKTRVAELDTQERQVAEAELAAKMEAAKPKPKETNLLASIIPVQLGKPTPATGPTVASVPVSVATATPINVPVPKESPLTADRPAAADADQTKAKRDDVIGNLLGFVQFPDLGKKDAPEPAAAVPPAQTTSPGQVTTAQRPTTVSTTQGPAKPTPAKPAQAAQVPAPPPATAPVAAVAETPWWKKLNPFGG